MTANTPPQQLDVSPSADDGGKGTVRIHRLFLWIRRAVVGMVALVMCYWLFASDRYVSEAIIIIQNTEKLGGTAFDLASLVGVGGGATRPDQLLLREHLLSVDMLEKLEDSLNLRAHYSDSRRDIASRMWFQDASIEWFHRHYLSRVAVTFDDFAGVLRVRAEGYAPETAKAITSMLVVEGERFMNKISHDLAQAQVDFLDAQVIVAHNQLLDAVQTLLDYQNSKGLASPQATAESIIAIVAKLEAQRTEIQTELAALPRSLVPKHPNIVRLKQSLAAVERQIREERAKLASSKGETLNLLVAEHQRLQMDVDFKRDVYKTALVALEKGRMDASRTIKQVSALQAPVMPEYALEPTRIYGAVVTLCVALLVLGIMKLLEAIVLDHVD